MHLNRLLVLIPCTLVLLLTSMATSIALVAGEFLPEPADATSPSATLIAVGDIMLSRMVMRRLARPPEATYPFTYVDAHLQSADAVFANLETPVTEGELIPTTSMKFRAEPGVEHILAGHNIRLISLANNHMLDQMKEGLMRTVELLQQATIVTSGAGANKTDAYAPTYMNVNGIRVALLAYVDSNFAPTYYRATNTSPGMAVMNRDAMQTAMKEAQEHADIILVSIHSGNEYTQTITSTQRNFSRAAIDAGADIVIGHHPHVIQERELRDGKPIYYSLGNFVFDQLWSDETRRGMMLKLTITKDAITHIEHIPVYIDTDYQPRLIEGLKSKQMIERLKIVEEKAVHVL